MLKPERKRPEFNPTSLVRMLWKRKGSAALIWALTSAATVIVVARLQPRYSAESVVLVESQKIPENYVAATVHVDLSERLDRLKQEVLSYDRLLGLIRQYDLYPSLRGTVPEPEIVRAMRDDVGITLERAWSAERPGAFRVSYMGAKPEATAAVVNQISRFFIDENRRGRQAQAEAISQFLENQMAQSKKNLEAQEARLKQYKVTYNGELPEQQAELIASLGQGKAELEGVKQELSRVQQNKILLQNSLNGISEIIRLRQQVAQERSAAMAALESRPEQEVKLSDRLRTNLSALRLRYGNSHPEVQRAAEELAAAEAAERNSARQAKAAPKASANARPLEDFAAATAAEQDRIAEINAQLAAADKDISDLHTREQRILAEVHNVEQRLAKLPIREQQLATVMRDYQISKSTYQSQLEKKLSADVASDMEKKHQAETFTILEEARIPEKPVRPRKTLLTIGGSLAGLVAGLMVGLALELKDGVVLGEWELPAGTDILARVPRMEGGSSL